MTINIDETFAVCWADAWNRRDVEAVLIYFHEDVVFTSPTALAITGAAMVRGKNALRAYWKAALSQVDSLRFEIDRLIWDPQQHELAIIYTSRIDGAAKKVSENFIFDEHGQIVRAEVFHGSPV